MSTQKIPVVLIGINRGTALETENVLAGTPYQLVAVLDLAQSPKDYQYSATNLGAVLHALHPRPQILATGTAVAKLVPEVEKVWEEYVNGIFKAEGGGKTAYVRLSDFHSEDAPPPPGTMEYLLDNLDAVFKS